MKAFARVLAAVQVLCIVLFWTCATYGSDVLENDATNTIGTYYAFHTDVYVMILMGFGLLYTFMTKYSHGALTLNTLLTCVAIQWSILVHGFWHGVFGSFETMHLDITSLIAGNFAAGCVLVSFGVLLGRATPLQLLCMALFEIVVYALNEQICIGTLGAVDMGGSLVLHAFGAIFGVMVSKQLWGRDVTAEEPGASRTSETFAMVGSLLLFIFWPSFNGALATGSQRHVVVINTTLALCASCLTSISLGIFLTGRLSFENVTNAILAGGVAVGSSADLVVGPGGALLIGAMGGVLVAVGFSGGHSWLCRKLNLYDPCAVIWLHGGSGILGGIGGCISAALARDSEFGTPIGEIFPMRAGEFGLTAGEQGVRQLYLILISVSIAITSGFVCGRLLRMLPQTADDDARDDDHLFLNKSESPSSVVIEVPPSSF